MFFYSGTNIPIQVNDMVSWYCDSEARGHIVVFENSYFSVYWNDIKLKLYQADDMVFLRKLI